MSVVFVIADIDSTQNPNDTCVPIFTAEGNELD